MSSKIVIAIVISAILFIPVYGKVISFVEEKSTEEKLGYLPQKEVLKIAALDHRPLISEWFFFKAIVYYGGRLERQKSEDRQNTEYDNIYRFLDTSTYLDPYNIDAYYFAQAVFTWELVRVREVNQLLKRGVEYRTWDFYLPFFLGFNNFYFLKDYKSASHYMEQTARITGNPFFTSLAARFLYESDETDIAISFLRLMIDKTWNDKIRKSLQMRLRALESIDFLKKGMKRFNELYHRDPRSIEEILSKGIIDKLPEDPYGGRFYIDDKRKIRTTSEFVLRGASGNRNKNGKSE